MSCVGTRAGHTVLCCAVFCCFLLCCAVLWEFWNCCVKFAVKILHFTFETPKLWCFIYFLLCKILHSCVILLCCAVLWAKKALMSSPGWHETPRCPLRAQADYMALPGAFNHGFYARRFQEREPSAKVSNKTNFVNTYKITLVADYIDHTSCRSSL